MAAKAQIPDYEYIAARLDTWIPQSSPVNEALLEHLPVYPAQRILDIACRTGKLELTADSTFPTAAFWHGGCGMLCYKNSAKTKEPLL